MLRVFNNFKPISLAETAQAVTGRRFESKFLLTTDVLNKLAAALGDFRILTIDGNNVFSYQNQYYDFGNWECYNNHHRGKLPRFKLRHRHYINTGIAFYEVKMKNNRGISEKKRVEAPTVSQDIVQVQHIFEELCGQSLPDLKQSICTHYDRCTLVSDDKKTRMTFDTGLLFSYNEQMIDKKNLVICELKSTDRKAQNLHNKQLIRLGALPTSFSKYLLGCAYLLPNIKTNRVKPLQHTLDKLTHANVGF